MAIRIEAHRLQELKDLANGHKTSQAMIVEVALEAFQKLQHDEQGLLIKEQIYKQFFSSSRGLNEVKNFLDKMGKK